MKNISTLGFIGLGVMGEPMCRNLVTKTKLPVYGTDLKREPVERLEANGLKACTSVAEVARAADLIFSRCTARRPSRRSAPQSPTRRAAPTPSRT